MSLRIPNVCQCGEHGTTCLKCQSPLNECYSHTKNMLCNLCSQIWKCDYCEKTSQKCHFCSSIIGLCHNHSKSVYCDRCYKLHRCSVGREECFIGKCRSCNQHLKTCFLHNNHYGYCEKCAPFKCRIPGCDQLMRYCQGYAYRNCKEVIPVCPNHGRFCDECHLEYTKGRLISDVSLAIRCYNCLLSIDEREWRMCSNVKCKALGRHYCIRCGKVLLVSTLRDKLRCYQCVSRSKFSRGLRCNLRQKIMGSTRLTRDVSGIIADYLLNSAPREIVIPDHVSRYPEYHSKCDTKTPIPPVARSSITTGYDKLAFRYGTSITQARQRAERNMWPTVYDFHSLYPSMIINNTLSLASCFMNSLLTSGVSEFVGNDYIPASNFSSLPALMPPANIESSSLEELD